VTDSGDRIGTLSVDIIADTTKLAEGKGEVEAVLDTFPKEFLVRVNASELTNVRNAARTVVTALRAVSRAASEPAAKGAREIKFTVDTSNLRTQINKALASPFKIVIEIEEESLTRIRTQIGESIPVTAVHHGTSTTPHVAASGAAAASSTGAAATPPPPGWARFVNPALEREMKQLPNARAIVADLHRDLNDVLRAAGRDPLAGSEHDDEVVKIAAIFERFGSKANDLIEFNKRDKDEVIGGRLSAKSLVGLGASAEDAEHIEGLAAALHDARGKLFTIADEAAKTYKPPAGAASHAPAPRPPEPRVVTAQERTAATAAARDVVGEFKSFMDEKVTAFRAATGGGKPGPTPFNLPGIVGMVLNKNADQHYPLPPAETELAKAMLAEAERKGIDLRASKTVKPRTRLGQAGIDRQQGTGLFGTGPAVEGAENEERDELTTRVGRLVRQNQDMTPLLELAQSGVFHQVAILGRGSAARGANRQYVPLTREETQELGQRQTAVIGGVQLTRAKPQDVFLDMAQRYYGAAANGLEEDPDAMKMIRRMLAAGKKSLDTPNIRDFNGASEPSNAAPNRPGAIWDERAFREINERRAAESALSPADVAAADAQARALSKERVAAMHGLTPAERRKREREAEELAQQKADIKNLVLPPPEIITSVLEGLPHATEGNMGPGGMGDRVSGRYIREELRRRFADISDAFDVGLKTAMDETGRPSATGTWKQIMTAFKKKRMDYIEPAAQAVYGHVRSLEANFEQDFNRRPSSRGTERVINPPVTPAMHRERELRQQYAKLRLYEGYAGGGDEASLPSGTDVPQWVHDLRQRIQEPNPLAINELPASMQAAARNRIHAIPAAEKKQIKAEHKERVAAAKAELVERVAAEREALSSQIATALDPTRMAYDFIANQVGGIARETQPDIKDEFRDVEFERGEGEKWDPENRNRSFIPGGGRIGRGGPRRAPQHTTPQQVERLRHRYFDIDPTSLPKDLDERRRLLPSNEQINAAAAASELPAEVQAEVAEILKYANPLGLHQHVVGDRRPLTGDETRAQMGEIAGGYGEVLTGSEALGENSPRTAHDLARKYGYVNTTGGLTRVTPSYTGPTPTYAPTSPLSATAPVMMATPSDGAGGPTLSSVGGGVSGPIPVVVTNVPLAVTIEGGGSAGGGGGRRRPRKPPADPPPDDAKGKDKDKTEPEVKEGDSLRMRRTTLPYRPTKPFLPGGGVTVGEGTEESPLRMADRGIYGEIGRVPGTAISAEQRGIEAREREAKAKAEKARKDAEREAAAAKRGVERERIERNRQLGGAEGPLVPRDIRARQLWELRQAQRSGAAAKESTTLQDELDRTARILSPVNTRVLESRVTAASAQQKLGSRSTGAATTGIFEQFFGGRQGPLLKVARLREASDRQRRLEDQLEDQQQRIEAAQGPRVRTAREITAIRRAGGTPSAELIATHKAYRQTVVDLTKASAKTSQAIGKVADEVTHLGKTAVGATDVLRNLFTGAVGGAVGGTIAGAAAQLVQGGIQMADLVWSPVLDKMTGFQGVTAKVTGALSDATLAASGNARAVVAQTAAQAGLSKANYDAIAPALEQRASIEAGNKAIQQQVELIRASENISRGTAGGPLGFTNNPGGIPGITQATGGAFGSAFGATPSTVEQMFGLLEPEISPMNALTSIFSSKPFWPGGAAPVSRPAGLNEQMFAELDKNIDIINEQAKKGQTSLQMRRNATDAQVQATYESAQRAHAGNDVLNQIKGERLGIVNQAGEVPDNALEVYASAYNRGAPVPDAKTLLESMMPTLEAQARQVARERQQAISNVAAGSAINLMAQPIRPLGRTLLAANTPADVRAQISASQSEYAGLNAPTLARAAEGNKFLDKLGVPQKLRDDLTAVGKQIDQIVGKEAAQQANEFWATYNHNVEIATRSVSDLVGFMGKASTTVVGPGGKTQTVQGSQIGQIQNRDAVLGRENQVLGFQQEENELNFQEALAGFMTPGETPEERAARQRHAKKQNAIKRKMLNNNKTIGDDQWTLNGPEGLITKRSLDDAKFQIEDIFRNRDITVTVSIDQDKMAALEKQRQDILDNIGAYTTAGNAAITAESQFITQFEVSTGKIITGLDEIATKIHDVFGLHPSGGESVGGKGVPGWTPATGTSEFGNRPDKDTGGPGNVTGVGSPVVIQILGGTFTDEQSRQGLIRDVSAAVQMGMDRKASLIGLRTPR
jgi:hypothetical protein